MISLSAYANYVDTQQTATFICWLLACVSIFACVYCVGEIITKRHLSDKKARLIWVGALSPLIVVALSVCINAAVTSQKDKAIDNVVTQVEETYSLNLNKDQDLGQIFSQALQEGVGGAAVAKFDDDTRLYEVYFVKNQDHVYSLYTKNEKGVYLPITKMAIAYQEK